MNATLNLHDRLLSWMATDEPTRNTTRSAHEIANILQCGITRSNLPAATAAGTSERTDQSTTNPKMGPQLSHSSCSAPNYGTRTILRSTPRQFCNTNVGHKSDCTHQSRHRRTNGRPAAHVHSNQQAHSAIQIFRRRHLPSRTCQKVANVRRVLPPRLRQSGCTKPYPSSVS